MNSATERSNHGQNVNQTGPIGWFPGSCSTSQTQSAQQEAKLQWLATTRRTSLRKHPQWHTFIPTAPGHETYQLMNLWSARLVLWGLRSTWPESFPTMSTRARRGPQMCPKHLITCSARSTSDPRHTPAVGLWTSATLCNLLHASLTGFHTCVLVSWAWSPLSLACKRCRNHPRANNFSLGFFPRCLTSNAAWADTGWALERQLALLHLPGWLHEQMHEWENGRTSCCACWSRQIGVIRVSGSNSMKAWNTWATHSFPNRVERA